MNRFDRIVREIIIECARDNRPEILRDVRNVIDAIEPEEG